MKSQFQLKEIADIQAGYPFRSRIDFDPAGETPVIQLRNISQNGQINVDSILSVKGLPNAERHVLQAGDVIYASKGERNMASIVPGDVKGAVPASYFFVIRSRTPTVLNEYLAWYINQPNARMFIQSQARRGSYIPMIAKIVFETLPVHVPSLATQRAIVELDRLKRREKMLSEKLEEKTSTLIARVCQRVIEGGQA